MKPYEESDIFSYGFFIKKYYKNNLKHLTLDDGNGLI